MSTGILLELRVCETTIAWQCSSHTGMAMQEAELGLERDSAAVMSGPVQGYGEEPEEAAPVKHIAKGLFHTGAHLSRPGINTLG